MAALLEMNTSPAEHEPALQAKTPMRFTYASGSRPLEGFTIKRGVGRGGFGEVYFAVSDAGKEVALKLIRRNLEVELRGVTHCLNLKHPNLIDLYDIRSDEHEDRWVIMEYVSGESLEDVIERYPQGMPREDVCRWFDGICAGVAYLHDHGIVHRDLKPANIFIDDGTIKIGDYGLSKFISCSRRSGQTESVGTVHYMAPEIANGRYGREIDAYALGIILFEMLTGHVPFEGESVGEVLMKHLTAEPCLEAVEEPFRDVVHGAMAKDPERRINTAAGRAAMLRGVPRATREAFDTAQYVRPLAGSGDGQGHAASPPAGRGGARPRSKDRQDEGIIAFFHRDPEPIWESVKAGAAATRKDLNFEQWTVTGKILFAGFCFFFFAAISAVLIPLLSMAACTYVGYRILRIIVRASTVNPYPQAHSQPRDQGGNAPAFAAVERQNIEREAPRADVPAHPVAAQAVPAPVQSRPWRKRGQAGWRQSAYEQLRCCTVRERASSLVGSMLAAGIIAPVAAVLICMLAAPESFSSEFTLWTATVATLGSWALMVPGQLAEGHVEDHIPLRFAQLLLGALVGVAAWALAQSLFLSLPASSEVAPGPTDSFFGAVFRDRYGPLDGGYRQGLVQPQPGMYAAYFAFLFAVLRWWRLAEWTRMSRVSLWTIAWCGFIAWGMTFFWWFPQPIGLMLAVVIAFTIQLSSPWLSPSRRRELAQKSA
ncbi:MAG: serine/threonine-protein kinase [Pirellulales bacterium]|nr:serine/threonine-protein kinase [Pirellulales bacterium]